jgi:hypothetical protein
MFNSPQILPPSAFRFAATYLGHSSCPPLQQLDKANAQPNGSKQCPPSQQEGVCQESINIQLSLAIGAGGTAV